MTSPQELVEKGLFLDAARAIDRSPSVSQELRVLRARIESAIGSLTGARLAAQGLLQEQLTPRERLICLEIVSRWHFREGHAADGLKAIDKAIEEAAVLQDTTAEARLIASHANNLLHFVGVDPAIPEISKLRRAALRSGDPFSLIEFHFLNSVVAAMRGNLAATAASISTTRCLLGRFPNTAQEGRLAIMSASLAEAHSDQQEALAWAATALKLGRLNGARSVLMPALNNLVMFKMTQGRFDEAKPYLEELLRLVGDTSATRLAYRDTQMLLALATDDLDGASEAEEHFQALVAGIGSRDSYYQLSHAPTRIRWLYRRGDTAAGVNAALGLLPRVERAANHALVARLRLLASEGLHIQGQLREAELMLGDAIRSSSDPSLELVAEGLRVSGRLSLEHNPQRACAYFDQAKRILAGIGHVAARDALNRETPNEAPRTMLSTESARSLAERIAVFLEFGAHVPTLASETLRLIEESRCAYKCVVSTTDHHGKRDIISSFVSDDCPSSLGDDAIKMELGSYREREFEVQYVSRPNLSDRTLLLGVERLVKGAIAVARDRQRARQSTAGWVEEPPEQHLGLVCSSAHTRELISTIRRVGQTNVNVLLTGETGVGKELFAKALHAASLRSDRTFLPFNCSTVPREMFDSQLFGHKRGSFTGAVGDSAGVIRAAAGGTLFLDEIGEMSLEAQPKLLRFLESGEILPLGETKPLHVDVRIVAATNANLDQLVADGKFREDLYYRLNVIKLNIPPLRERREEIPALVEHFLERFGQELQKPLMRIADETLEYLVLYRWPGNVRQLANEIRRLVAMAEPGGVIMPAHLSNDIAESRRTLPVNRSPRLFDEVVTRIDQPLSAAVEHIERAAIQRALAMTDGHLDEAARILGLSRKGLYLKRQRLNLG